MRRIAWLWIRHPSRYFAYLRALPKGPAARADVVNEDWRRYRV